MMFHSSVRIKSVIKYLIMSCILILLIKAIHTYYISYVKSINRFAILFPCISASGNRCAYYYNRSEGKTSILIYSIDDSKNSITLSNRIDIPVNNTVTGLCLSGNGEKLVYSCGGIFIYTIAAKHVINLDENYISKITGINCVAGHPSIDFKGENITFTITAVQDNSKSAF